jgi:hypothetical protein
MTEDWKRERLRQTIQQEKEKAIVDVLRTLAERLREQHLHGHDELKGAADLIEQQKAAIARVREMCEAKAQEVKRFPKLPIAPTDASF